VKKEGKQDMQCYREKPNVCINPSDMNPNRTCYFPFFIGDIWYEAGDHLAREKVGQCFRDMLSGQYRSSAKAKKMSRKVKQIMLDDEVDQMVQTTGYKDFSQRVRELTKQAVRDSDFQRAFNQANAELLQTFKTEERATKGDDDDDDDDHASVVPSSATL